MKTTSYLVSAILLPLLASASFAAQEASKETPKSPKLAKIMIGGEITEGPEAPVTPSLFSFGPKPKRLQTILHTIRKAKEDKEVAGMLLRVEGSSMGWAKLNAIRNALIDFKASGKKIHVHFDAASTGEYVLHCAASDISMIPSGMLALPGLHLEINYIKDLLEWAGIKADVIHIGEFKTAFESWARSEMSEGQRTSLNDLLDGIFEQIVGSIAQGRKMGEDRVKAAIDTGILTAAQARARGLIDQVEYEDEFHARLKKEYGDKLEILERYGKPEREEIDFSDFTFFIKIFSEMSKKPEKVKGDKIAIVYAVGAIESGKSEESGFGGQSMGSQTMVKAIREAAEDNTVKAIVLRVDSPGGSAIASDEIWREVVRAKEKKPVVVSMSDVAASGGYWISMSADAIVAEPTTITGSIGVVGMKPVLGGMYQKVGIRPQVLQRGKMSGISSLSQPFSPEERLLITKLMDTTYNEFVSKVSAGRGRAFEEIEKVARGRIWMGKQAKQLGLVDELGGLEDAIRIAKTKAGIDPAKELKTLELPRPKTFMEILEEGDFSFAQVAAALPQGTLERALIDPKVRHAYRQVAAMLRMKDRVLCLLPVDISWN